MVTVLGHLSMFTLHMYGMVASLHVSGEVPKAQHEDAQWD